MAEITIPVVDQIQKAWEYNDDLVAELVHNIISRSDKAEAYSKLLRDSNNLPFESDREKAILEKIQLANTILSQYITREF